MILDFFELKTPNGLVELVNNERTTANARALGIYTIGDCGCTFSNNYSCEPGPYTCFDATQCEVIKIPPPWYDALRPQTLEFAGLLLLNVTGFDSTFSRQTNERKLDGYGLSVPRRGGRSMTFEGMLVGSTECGIEEGLAYYDSILANAGSCNYFDLVGASCCPVGTETPTQLEAYKRHLRRCSLTSGIKVIDTHVLGNSNYYADVQFTISAENPWIYGASTTCLSASTFNQADCACNIKWIGQANQPKPVKIIRETRESRTIYPISIRPDNTICKIGTWNWSDTQFGGGTGIVAISDFIEKAADPAQNTQECHNVNNCIPYNIEVVYDKTIDRLYFNTIRWNNPGTSQSYIPCDCDIRIAKYTLIEKGTVTDPMLPNPNITTTVSAPAYNPSEEQCYVQLQWDSPTSGKVRSFVNDPVSNRSQYRASSDFPPVGCSLTISRACYNDLICYDFGNGRWGASKTGVAPYTITGCEGGSCGKDLGCFTPNPCLHPREYEAAILARLTTIVGTTALPPCDGSNKCIIKINTANNTWTTDGTWVFDKTLAFPSTSCTYSLQPQKEDLIQVQHITTLAPAPCGAILSSDYDSLGCFPQSGLLSAPQDAFATCYCQPIYTIEKCCLYSTNSSTYDAVGIIDVYAGSSDLSNMNIKAYFSPWKTIVSPCTDYSVWADREPDWQIEVGNLPKGSHLIIDSEINKAIVVFPGDIAIPAARFISGRKGAPLDYLVVPACENAYLVVSADCAGTASNARVSIALSQRYGASGTLVGGK